MASSSSAKPANQPLIEPIPTRSIENGSTAFNSSPVIGTKDPTLPNPTELEEPQLPTNDGTAAAEAPATFQKSRREMFRMIESIRSSSPAHTPGKLGFDTPSHLRRLHAQTGIPLTPTLVPAENEEGFIGSSPTPATRDLTPAMNLEAPGGQFQDITMEDATDLPSSPPELTSRSPSPKKMSSSSRRARRRKRLQSSVAEEARKQASVPQADERPPSRRTRSALTQSTANDQNADAAPAPPMSTSEIIPKTSEKLSTPQSAKSKSSSKKRKRKGGSKAADGIHEQTAQVPSTPVALQYFVDSSSEDLESQIASQLEQDLELAVDMVGKGQSGSALAIEDPEPATKKRKREEDNVQSTSRDRRRSTRLSTTKDLGITEVEETQVTQSQDTTISQPSKDVPSSNLSPTVTRRSTRSSQKKESELVIAQPVPETQIPETIPEERPKDPESSQRPNKRSRKSLRLEDQSPPPLPLVEEQISTCPKSSRSSRSRKSRSSRNETQSQTRHFQEQRLPVEPVMDNELLSASNDNTIAGSDLIAPQEPVESQTAPSSKEETHSQMTDVNPSTAPVSQGTNIQQNMDVDMVSENPSTSVPGPVLDVATPEIQTEPVPPTVEPDISEAGISRSLRKLLDDMKSAKLGPNALREVDDLLFNIRVEAHDASRRHNNPA